MAVVVGVAAVGALVIAVDDGDVPGIRNPFLAEQALSPATTTATTTAGDTALATAVAASSPTSVPTELPSAVPPVAPVRRAGPPTVVHERHIDVATGQPGMQSFLLYAPMRQPARTSGPATDIVRAVFDAPVDVHGASASVDLSADLFELALGIDKPVYGGNSAGWLFHYTSQRSASIDQSVMFPRPFRVDPTQYLSLTAWIANPTQEQAVAQPEVIVFFTPAGS